MLDPRDVLGIRPGEMAAGKFLSVELDELAFGHQLRGELAHLAHRALAPVHVFRLCEPGDVIHPVRHLAAQLGEWSGKMRGCRHSARIIAGRSPHLACDFANMHPHIASSCTIWKTFSGRTARCSARCRTSNAGGSSCIWPQGLATRSRIARRWWSRRAPAQGKLLPTWCRR